MARGVSAAADAPATARNEATRWITCGQWAYYVVVSCRRWAWEYREEDRSRVSMADKGRYDRE